MSYDFHLSDDGVLKLIEINTNASFLAMGHLMYEAHQLAHPIAQFSLLDIVQNIHEEFALNGQRGEPQIAIIDEEPEQQRLYIEFLVYNQLFQKAGLQSQICDFRKIPANVNFVYNRYTDFYFSRPESELLLQDFTTKKRCFSPNPYEYDLLANKQRLIDWNTQGLFQKHLPKAHLVTDENLEMLWQNKKSFFFKPLTSFGSKQSYRGEKMTRKILQAMPNGFIAQEYIEPPSENFQTPSGPIKFKYDLRFYAYQDKVQCAVARLYQGQLTNLKTPLGGFAPIVFHSEDLKHPTRVST